MTWISSPPSRNSVPGFHGVVALPALAAGRSRRDAVTRLWEKKDLPQELDSRHSCLSLIRHGDGF